MGVRGRDAPGVLLPCTLRRDPSSLLLGSLRATQGATVQERAPWVPTMMLEANREASSWGNPRGGEEGGRRDSQVLWWRRRPALRCCSFWMPWRTACQSPVQGQALLDPCGGLGSHAGAQEAGLAAHAGRGFPFPILTLQGAARALTAVLLPRTKGLSHGLVETSTRDGHKRGRSMVAKDHGEGLMEEDEGREFSPAIRAR